MTDQLSQADYSHIEARVLAQLETTAREIAAKKCGLVKDPKGENLPDEIWQQALPEAMKFWADMYTARMDGFQVPKSPARVQQISEHGFLYTPPQEA